MLLDQEELDGQRQPIPKLGVFLAQGLVLLDQLFSGRAARVFCGHGSMDLLGMVVDALAAAMDLLSLVRDGPGSNCARCYDDSSTTPGPIENSEPFLIGKAEPIEVGK